MDYDSESDNSEQSLDLLNNNITSIWHNLELCNCSDVDECNIGCAHIGKNIDINNYVEYCKAIDPYVIGKNWYGKKVYGYNFEFKLKSNNGIYKLNTNLVMDYSFENKWHWTPLRLGFNISLNGITLEHKNYDFILKEVELIDNLKDYQLVARSICYYNGLPFKSGK
jgi:hypothetical protein